MQRELVWVRNKQIWKKALAGSDFEKKEDTGYTEYTIKDSKSLTYGYDIVVRDGVITGIEVDNQRKFDEFRKAMGVQ